MYTRGVKDIVKRPARPLRDQSITLLRDRSKLDVSGRPVRTSKSGKSGLWQNKIKSAYSDVRRWAVAHPRLLTSVGITIMTLVVVMTIYRAGYSHGRSAQKKIDDEQVANVARTAGSSGSDASRSQSRSTFSSSGTIESISASEIVIKAPNGDNKTATLNKDTVINNAKNAKVEVKALKKGDRVFITGAIENNSSVVRRIRVLPPKS